MKFVADVMLGRLAKRLRLLGYDVLYGSFLDDNEIIRLSVEQDRVILTRDVSLARRPLASNHLIIESERIGEQLAQVVSAYPSASSPLTRCSACNGVLESVEKGSVHDLVPQYVYQTHADYRRCPACGRIYWKGSHVVRMGSARRGY